MEHGDLVKLTDDMSKKEHEMRLALLAPFCEYYIFWKVQATFQVEGSRGRGMMVTYVDARAVEDRLDAVFGPTGWTEEYYLDAGSVQCTLYTRWPSGWVSKSSYGDEKGEGAMAKESRALKRAAVKFGIGRYLYRIPKAYVDVEKRGKAWYPARGQTPTLEAIAPWALPRSSDGLKTDVPYWEAEELAAHVEAVNATLPEPELPPINPNPPKRQAAKVAPGTGKDPRALIADAQEAANRAAKAGQAREHVQGKIVLKDDPAHPVPPNWKALYDRALEGELGEYKARKHVQASVRQWYPGFAVKAKAERQNVTLKEVWDVLRYRSLSPEAKAVVMARHGLTDPKLAPAQGDSVPATAQKGDEKDGPPAQAATVKAEAPNSWLKDTSEGGAMARFHAFLAKAGVSPAEAGPLLGVPSLMNYQGTVGSAVIAICEAKALTYHTTDKGVNVDWPE